MKQLLFAILLALPLLAEQSAPVKPVIHTSISPEDVLHYSSSFDDASKFEFKHLSWKKFTAKYKQAWILTEEGWVRVDLKQNAPLPLMLSHGRIRDSGGVIIVSPTISGGAYKK